MSWAAAQAVCIALIATDFVARALRIQWILRGLGSRITLREALTLNAFGDAGCALTPLRLGGEPARLGGMLRAGVSPPAAFVAISFEVLAAWPVIIVAAGVLMVTFAPDWWAAAAPRLAHSARHAGAWIAAVCVLSAAAWLAGAQLRVSIGRQLRRPIRRARVFWRRMPLGPLVASAPLTLVDLVTRVGILPVLASTLAAPPPVASVWVGSFALLYVQLLLPTPSGAGVVELGFLGGAAGELGGDQAALLVAWRFYTNGVGLLLGAGLAIRSYGWPAVRHAIMRAAGR